MPSVIGRPANGAVPNWARTTCDKKTAIQQRRADALEDRLFDLMLHARHEETQLHACVALHAIINGSSVARAIATAAVAGAVSSGGREPGR